MQQSLPLGGEGEGSEIEMIMNEKELDKLLKAALERRAARVPPLPSDFAEKVLQRHRASAVRSTSLRLLWAGGIAAALVVGFFLWPQEQAQQPGPAASTVVAEVVETERPLSTQDPPAPFRRSNECLEEMKPAKNHSTPATGKHHVVKRPAKKEHSMLPLKGDGGSGAGRELPVISPDKQALVDIFLAEEALQVAYKLQEPLEELRAFYANFDEEAPDTTIHIIAI